MFENLDNDFVTMNNVKHTQTSEVYRFFYPKLSTLKMSLFLRFSALNVNGSNDFKTQIKLAELIQLYNIDFYLYRNITLRVGVN